MIELEFKNIEVNVNDKSAPSHNVEDKFKLLDEEENKLNSKNSSNEAELESKYGQSGLHVDDEAETMHSSSDFDNHIELNQMIELQVKEEHLHTSLPFQSTSASSNKRRFVILPQTFHNQLLSTSPDDISPRSTTNESDKPKSETTPQQGAPPQRRPAPSPDRARHKTAPENQKPKQQPHNLSKSVGGNMVKKPLPPIGQMQKCASNNELISSHQQEGQRNIPISNSKNNVPPKNNQQLKGASPPPQLNIQRNNSDNQIFRSPHKPNLVNNNKSNQSHPPHVNTPPVDTSSPTPKSQYNNNNMNNNINNNNNKTSNSPRKNEGNMKGATNYNNTPTQSSPLSPRSNGQQQQQQQQPKRNQKPPNQRPPSDFQPPSRPPPSPPNAHQNVPLPNRSPPPIPTTNNHNNNNNNVNRAVPPNEQRMKGGRGAPQASFDDSSIRNSPNTSHLRLRNFASVDRPLTPVNPPLEGQMDFNDYMGMMGNKNHNLNSFSKPLAKKPSSPLLKPPPVMVDADGEVVRISRNFIYDDEEEEDDQKAKMEERSTIIYDNQTRYEAGNSQGRGRLYFPNGDYYEGEVKNGVAHGIGMSIDALGNQYIGEWKNNRKNGRGRLTTSFGEFYNGEFANDVKEGKGEYHLCNGDNYIGQFRDNIPNGFGSMYFLFILLLTFG